MRKGAIVIATVRSANIIGVTGCTVDVEVHVSNGLPGFTIVGLPDTAVREARERVRAAMLSSGLPWPQKRVTVNLAPGWVRKSGAGLDLALALSLLLAVDELPAGVLDGVGVIGELGLDGTVRSIPGTLALVAALRDAGCDTVIVSPARAAEAALVDGMRVLSAPTLAMVRLCLKGEAPWEPVDGPVIGGSSTGSERTGAANDLDDEPCDLSDVRGQPQARRALEVCAAGAHHLLFAGPPGGGKTMLARRLPSILPPLDNDEALEVTRIHSAAGAEINGLIRSRPFRMPHHGASVAAIVGGGTGRPRPGELSMAHRGVLFLDELGEYSTATLDALRQPIEDRCVHVARSQQALIFPASCVLIACTNPCPCGLGPPLCMCDPGRLAKYRRRLSAPLLDRFDIRVYVSAPSPLAVAGESSDVVRERVAAAVARQRRRYDGLTWRSNAHVPPGLLPFAIPLSREATAALHDIAVDRDLTARGAARVRRVARTLADLDDCEGIDVAHVVLAADLRGEVLA